jgi:hypothetical protein
MPKHRREYRVVFPSAASSSILGLFFLNAFACLLGLPDVAVPSLPPVKKCWSSGARRPPSKDQDVCSFFPPLAVKIWTSKEETADFLFWVIFPAPSSFFFFFFLPHIFHFAFSLSTAAA